jgi:hypothetical protein
MSLVYRSLGTNEYLDEELITKIHNIESAALAHTMGKIKRNKRFLVKFAGFLLTIKSDMKNRNQFSPQKLKDA